MSVARVLERGGKKGEREKKPSGNILKGNQCSLAAAVRH